MTEKKQSGTSAVNHCASKLKELWSWHSIPQAATCLSDRAHLMQPTQPAAFTFVLCVPFVFFFDGWCRSVDPSRRCAVAAQRALHTANGADILFYCLWLLSF